MSFIISIIRYALCAIWAILTITTSLLLMVLLVNRKIPVIMARTIFAPGILWICGVKLRVEGVENIEPGQSYVFISNHLSYLDIPVLFRVIPHNLHFVAKKEIKKIPFIGWYMMATGMIFVDRSNRVRSRESMTRAAKLISRGKDVLIFPEGTRSPGGEPVVFKRGAFNLAADAHVPVVPVALSGTEFIMARGDFFIRPGQVHVRIGKPVSIGQEGINKFAEDLRHDVIGLYREILTKKDGSTRDQSSENQLKMSERMKIES